MDLEDRKRDLECQKLEMDLAERRGSHDYSRLYVFQDAVGEISVARCVRTIGEWFRKEPEWTITIVFTSPGGSVFDGLGLFDYIRYLRDCGAVIDTEVLGWGASMAAVLLQAGETRRIGRNAWVMIHEPSSGMRGKASDFADEAELMARLAEQGFNILAERSTLTAVEIAEKCDRRNWWMSAAEALEFGLVDQLF